MLVFLLTICDDQDQEKITYICKAYHESMMRYAQYQLRKLNVPNPESAAEDVVQNAFLKIIRAIKKVNFARGENALKSYVFTVVYNESINYTEEYIATSDIDDCVDIATEDEFFAQLPIKEEYDRVLRAIEAMDDIYRYTLMYRYTQEMSVKEIAEIMGISQKTVYTRLERGKKQLLEQLEKEGNSYV